MKKGFRWLALGALALGFAGCVTTAKNSPAALFSTVANPMAGVLQGYCTGTMLPQDSKACLDYNLIGNACANGIAVPGFIGTTMVKDPVLTALCQANGYPIAPPFVPLQFLPLATPTPTPAPLAIATPAPVTSAPTKVAQ